MGQGCGGEAQFDLPEKLRTACWLMVDRVRWLLAHVGLGAFGQGEEGMKGVRG